MRAEYVLTSAASRVESCSGVGLRSRLRSPLRAAAVLEEYAEDEAEDEDAESEEGTAYGGGGDEAGCTHVVI